MSSSVLLLSTHIVPPIFRTTLLWCRKWKKIGIIQNSTACLIDWLSKAGLSSHQTQYASYRGRVFTDQMTQSTVSRKVIRIGLQPTRSISPCYHNTTHMHAVWQDNAKKQLSNFSNVPERSSVTIWLEPVKADFLKFQIIRLNYFKSETQKNLGTVKWAQWDKTQSREL